MAQVVTRNYRAVVEYDGTDYSGFQIQAARPTIQGELERALRRITQEQVRVCAAGRTDAGVHARGQVISFRTEWSQSCEALQRALNAVLPQHIAVHSVAWADERFHARFSARSRVYIYSIYNGQVRSPLIGRYTHHVVQAVDVAAMQIAASSLVGEHDFAAFGQAPSGDNTVRAVSRAAWRASPAALWMGWDGESHNLLQIEIEANAFLRGMVRRVVGTLLTVGMGILTPAGFAEILAARDISRAAAPAPACGLCLWQVRYDPDREYDGQHGQVKLSDWQ